MTKRKHTVEEVLKALSKKHDVRVLGGTIQVLKPEIEKDGKIIENPVYQGDLGNGSWGKIDFLKGQGYSFVFVGNFN